VQDSDFGHTDDWFAVFGGGAGEALEAVERDGGDEAAMVVGEGSVALYFRAGGLSQVFVKGEAVDVAGEYSTLPAMRVFLVKSLRPKATDVGSALIDSGGGGGAGQGFFDAAVEEGVPADG